MSDIAQVKDIVPFNQYVASAGQTVFVYPFPIFDEGDVAVEQNGTLLTLSTDYTVSGVAAEDGGNITLTSGATAGDILTIYRDMALERLIDYQQNGDFLAANVNRDFDRLWLAMQQLQGGASNGEGVGRAWRASPSDSLTGQELIIADEATRSGRFVGFNSNGKFTYSSPAISSDPSQIYSDVLTMQNDSSLTVGVFVRTVGYTTPGDGGGNGYEIVAAGTGTADGGSFIDLPGSGLQARGLFLNGVDVRQFGASESGDATPSIQAAINYSGAISFGEDGIVFSVTKLTGRSDANWTGNAVLDFSGNASFSSDVSDPLIIFSGSANTSIAATSDINYGDLTIFVTDTSTISPGDVIEISTPGNNGGFIDSSIDVTNGEICKVLSVDSATQLTLSDAIVDSTGYSVANSAQIRKLNTLTDITIGNDITIVGKGRDASGPGDVGITFAFCENVKIHCNFINVDLSSVRFEECYNYEASSCTVIHPPKGANNTINYGIVPSTGSKYGRLFNNHCENMRHGIVTSHLSSADPLGVLGVCRNLDIYENTVVNNWHAGIGTHNDCDQLQVHDNRVQFCQFGINVRERNVDVYDNEIIGCAQSLYLTAYPMSISMRNNKSISPLGSHVFTAFSTDRIVDNIKIANNYFVGGTGGINLAIPAGFPANNISVSDNNISNISGPGGASAVIRYQGEAAATLNICDNEITDCSAISGISTSDGGDKVVIDGNKISNIDLSGITTQGVYTSSYAKNNYLLDITGSDFIGGANLTNSATISSDNTTN